MTSARPSFFPVGLAMPHTTNWGRSGGPRALRLKYTWREWLVGYGAKIGMVKPLNPTSVPTATHIAGMGAGWWWVAGQLLASAVILVSVRQDLGLGTRMGAALGTLMAAAFGVSALVTAIRMNLRGGAAICAVVLCFEILLILRWILRRQNKTTSR